ncbi:MAG: ATP-dependent zinc metalloprotease FtsH [Bacteriovorax sp.]
MTLENSENKEAPDDNIYRKKFNPLFIIFIVLLVLWMKNYSLRSTQIAEIPYSEFQQLLSQKKINDLAISDKFIRGKFTESRTDKKTEFLTTRVEPELARDLANSNVKYSRVIESTFIQEIFSWLLPVLLFFGIWLYLGKKFAEKGGLSGGLLSVGKSRAKLYMETDVKISFADVAGVDEAKEELQEVVEFLKNPAEYGRLGARMPRGILLIGPPGTGKTMLAKAVAGEAKVPFFSISGSEFVELFVGVGAARVRDLFQQAREKAPCIVFIDELDSLGRTRGVGMFGGHDEKEQTLNQLLAELDGFDTKTGVILLAATNRPEILDPALLRAGRFDRQVLIDKPDKVGREAILRVHIKKIKYEENLKLDHIASLTPGFTGADLANLVNEAALAATRRKSQIVNEEDFTVAIERIIAGLEKRNRIFNPQEKKIIAFHEMGHALVASAIPGTDKVHKISIISRGIGSLGYTIQRPTEDRYLMTKQELLNKMAVLLGGRMAETLIFDEISTGASDDLVKVTNIAEAIVTKYGMSSIMGPIVFETQPSPFLQGAFPESNYRPHSDETSKKIDLEIKTLVDEAGKRAMDILVVNRALLEEGAGLLLEKETLSEDMLKELIAKIKMVSLSDVHRQSEPSLFYDH